MEKSESHTTTSALSGICDADKEHFGTWDKWYEICFDKNGRYIEENERIFEDFMKRHESKTAQAAAVAKQAPSTASKTSTASKQKESEFSF